MAKSAPPGPRNNFGASADPTQADDSTSGYSVGSLWINRATSILWTCFNNAVGSAIWQALSPGSSSGTTPSTSGPTTVPSYNTASDFLASWPSGSTAVATINGRTSIWMNKNGVADDLLADRFIGAN